MVKIVAFRLISLLLVCSLTLVNVNAQSQSSKGKISKASISFRIGLGQSLSKARFSQLLDLFDKYKGVTDEITFFTSSTHPPIPLSTFKEHMEILKTRMIEARKRGYRTGINILSTIGHHNENLDNSLKGDYTNVTDINGKISNGSFCPNNKKFQREYIQEVYKFMTLAEPDYIWLDDDIRLAGHRPIYLTCFCDNCLLIFESEVGKKYTRESLSKAFNEGTTGEKLLIRNAWLRHNRNTIARLFMLIEQTVHEIRPDLPLGFMTGDRFFEGYDFDNWAKILSGPGNSPVMWRPGGGYYLDNTNSELTVKSHAIGRQVAALQPEIVSIQSEIENFPYQRLKKAAKIVSLEASSHIAAGCTGAAFNVLSFYDEPLDEYEPLLNRLKQTRPFFDLMAKNLGRTPLTGVNTFWNKNSFVTGNLTNGDWLSAGTPVLSHEIYDIGLPASYSNEKACVTILGKDNILSLSKEEIKNILSGGVYMEAAVLQQLNDMGFRELTGFDVISSEDKDRIEKFTNNELNGKFVGWERDNRQSFWNTPAYGLKKTNNNAQVLTKLIDYSGKEVSACAMGIFENKLGGRVCIGGYYPWSFMENLSKSFQMKSVFKWLSKDKLPGYIQSFHKINLWIREANDDGVALAFTNSSFDPAKNVMLILRTKANKIKVYDMQSKETIIKSSGTDGAYQKFVIPSVDPWEIRLVISEK